METPCVHYSLQVEQEHAVVAESDPDLLLVTEGEQGPPGISAYESWLKLHPGGTWGGFMSELSSGTTWATLEW